MVKLIRKNNAELTAYQDSVMFNLAKGTNGIIKNVGSEFDLTYNWPTSTFLISSGMGIAYGRQFEIPAGEMSGLALDDYPVGSFFNIYFKIDLSDPSNETVTLTFNTATAAYPPLLDLGDDLTTQPNGICLVPIYKLQKLAQGASVTKIAKIILPDTVPLADLAHNATEAELALNAEKVNNLIVTEEYNTKRVYVNHKNTTNNNCFIERKQLVFSGDFYESAADVVDGNYPVLSLTEEINSGDLLEFHVYSHSLQQSQVLRAYVTAISIDTELPTGSVNRTGVRLLMHTSNYTMKDGSNTANYYRYNVDVAIFQLIGEFNLELIADWQVVDIYQPLPTTLPYGNIAITKIFKIVGFE